jgi:hypothetical protein
MKEAFISIITVIGIVIGGLAAVHTFSEFSGNYAYAGEFDGSQNEQNTGDNQTDSSNNNGDNGIQGIKGDSNSNSQKNNDKDKSAPTVLSVKPNYGTVGIPLDTTIEATFSEPVRASSVTISTFKLENSADNTPVLSDVSLSVDGTIATLTPTAPLSPSTSYKATVTTGLKDLAGNKIASDETWTFTTGEGAPTSSNNPNPEATSSLDNGQISKQTSDIVMQSMQDDQLVERIFPLIVNKLDGATILKKVDGQQLLEKVLPYLDIKLVGREQLGSKKIVDVSGILSKYADSIANCNDDEIVSGGGFFTTGDVSASNHFSANGWHVTAHAATDFTVEGNVQCIKIEVGTKLPALPAPPGGSPPFMRGSEPTPPGLILPP